MLHTPTLDAFWCVSRSRGQLSLPSTCRMTLLAGSKLVDELCTPRHARPAALLRAYQFCTSNRPCRPAPYGTCCTKLQTCAPQALHASLASCFQLLLAPNHLQSASAACTQWSVVCSSMHPLCPAVRGLIGCTPSSHARPCLLPYSLQSTHVGKGDLSNTWL